MASLMTNRALPYLFGGIMGLAAVGVAINWRMGQEKVLREERKKVQEMFKNPTKVIVAKADIPEGTVMEDKHVAEKIVPQQFLQPYTTSKAEDMLGMVTVVPISEGEQIQRTKLRRAHETAGKATMAAVTPEGKRAITIAINPLTGVGGFIGPGDQVDILWTFQVQHPDGKGAEPVTTTLFQDVAVLAVGHQLLGKGADEDEKSQAGGTVTLALNPQEAAFLLFARDQGAIQLSLRSKTDKGKQVPLAPANMATLMEAIFGPAPQPPPEKVPRKVEVYKGLERSVISVDE